jgi:hypothetical protein
MHQMVHRNIVAAPESIAIVMSRTWRNMRMAKFVAVIHVRRAVVVEVLARPFNAVVETLTLNVTKLLRRGIPSTRCLAIAGWWRWSALSQNKAGSSQRESKYWKCKSIELHSLISSMTTARFVQMIEFRVLLY